MSGDTGTERPDLRRLERLRARFLGATEVTGPVADYWQDDEDLAAYDAVFAARIGWKWDAVVDELVHREFGRADDALVVDWGCGTGIAARRFAAGLGAGRLAFFDRSARAAAFAAARATTELDGVHAEAIRSTSGLSPDVLLVSHVLDELDASAEAALLDLVERSARVVWVEPGSRAVSRLLSAHRDRLAAVFQVVAPCPHQGPCSALAHPDERQWCHFFARPPVEVFTDGAWARLGREIGIDLRALPYAFVALTRATGAAPPRATARMVGRPDVGGKAARVFACDAAGLHLVRVFKGRQKDVFRALKKEGERLRDVRLTHEPEPSLSVDMPERAPGDAQDQS